MKPETKAHLRAALNDEEFKYHVGCVLLVCLFVGGLAIGVVVGWWLL